MTAPIGTPLVWNDVRTTTCLRFSMQHEAARHDGTWWELWIRWQPAVTLAQIYGLDTCSVGGSAGLRRLKAMAQRLVDDLHVLAEAAGENVIWRSRGRAGISYRLWTSEFDYITVTPTVERLRGADLVRLDHGWRTVRGPIVPTETGARLVEEIRAHAVDAPPVPG